MGRGTRPKTSATHRPHNVIPPENDPDGQFRQLGRSVAIKLLPEAFSHDAERVARLEREARVLASLNHSNIAAIYGLEESDGRNFLVMEFVGTYEILATACVKARHHEMI
jgi:serine/threonine protein kinase